MHDLESRSCLVSVAAKAFARNDQSCCSVPASKAPEFSSAYEALEAWSEQVYLFFKFNKHVSTRYVNTWESADWKFNIRK